MARYLLIDNDTGYVWGDTAALAGWPAADETIGEAARLLDESLGEHGRTYAELPSNPRTSATGYDVYRADIDGSDAIGDIWDGQNPETIAAVKKDCQYVGYVAVTEAD